MLVAPAEAADRVDVGLAEAVAGAVAVLDRADRGQRARSGDARRGQRGRRQRLLDLGRAEAEQLDDAGRRRARLGGADDGVLEAPAPAVACARHRRPILGVPKAAHPQRTGGNAAEAGPPAEGRTFSRFELSPCPTSPPSSPAARGAPTRSRSTGATTTTTRRPRARRPPTPPSPRCATAARRATTAWPRAWSATSEHDGRLTLHLQPTRWALRLVEGDASLSVAALCVTRAADGRWLAGRRAPWLSSWPGRWALGAGGAVDVGESPVDTLTRELREEWSVAPERVRVRGARAPPAPPRDVRRPGVAARGRRGHARPRARRPRVVAGVDRRLAARGRRAAAADGRLLPEREPLLRHPQAAVVHPLGDLPHAAGGLDRARACTRSSSSSAWPTASAGSRCAS